MVEPGAFRSGFNTAGAIGSSEALPAYREQMDTLKATFDRQDGQQAGDLAQAAAVILEALATDQPPLHLALGDDAVDSISATLAHQRDELATWEYCRAAPTTLQIHETGWVVVQRGCAVGRRCDSSAFSPLRTSRCADGRSHRELAATGAQRGPLVPTDRGPNVRPFVAVASASGAR